jgi:hypothetical protein
MVMAHAGCAASATRKDLLELAFRVGDVCITIKVTFRQVTPKTQTKTGGRDRDVLTLTASGWPRISGINTEWSDGGAGRIEDQVLAIARDLLVIGELTYREWEKEQYAWQTRRKNEVEQMAREAQERREREETARMLWEETQRRDWLFQQAVDLRRADEIRALVRAQDAIRSVPDERRLDEIYEQWRAWALHEADELDPRLRPLNELVTPPDRGGSQT